MYELGQLCQKIGMPEEVTSMILTGLEEDDLGLHDLRFQLLTACRTWEKYQKLGIPETVYLDTMSYFSGFVQEYKNVFGCYGYEWLPWHYPLVHGELFRIGTLEYRLEGWVDAADIGEYNHRNDIEDGDEYEEEKLVSIHVPTGTDLRLPVLRASWERAKAVLGRAFPEYRDVPWVCHSWLLSPQLPQLLPPESRILAFQRSFVIEEMEDDGDFENWIYPNAEGDDMNLPEDTTLQLNLKYWILAEFPFHSGKGILVPDPFLK